MRTETFILAGVLRSTLPRLTFRSTMPYSLVTDLLTGNANVVRVPSRDFPQVRIINRAITDALGMEAHAGMRGYICLVRYDRSRDINDMLSAMADIRIIWSGDATVAELRRSPLGPRASEITFADRFSLAAKVSAFPEGLMELKDHSGYFFEYDCGDILELRDLCNDIRCQTIAYIGNREMFFPLLASGVRGIDRIVPVGRTMDFDFIWDGYNLYERMTRTVIVSGYSISSFVKE